MRTLSLASNGVYVRPSNGITHEGVLQNICPEETNCVKKQKGYWLVDCFLYIYEFESYFFFLFLFINLRSLPKPAKNNKENKWRWIKYTSSSMNISFEFFHWCSTPPLKKAILSLVISLSPKPSRGKFAFAQLITPQISSKICCAGFKNLELVKIEA